MDNNLKMKILCYPVNATLSKPLNNSMASHRSRVHNCDITLYRKHRLPLKTRSRSRMIRSLVCISQSSTDSRKYHPASRKVENPLDKKTCAVSIETCSESSQVDSNKPVWLHWLPWNDISFTLNKLITTRRICSFSPKRWKCSPRPRPKNENAQSDNKC